MTNDIVKIAYERISGVDGDFDGERVKGHLPVLLDRGLWSHISARSQVHP